MVRSIGAVRQLTFVDHIGDLQIGSRTTGSFSAICLAISTSKKQVVNKWSCPGSKDYTRYLIHVASGLVEVGLGFDDVPEHGDVDRTECTESHYR